MRPPIHRQQGVVLAVSLIILLVLTLIGVTAMRTTVTEEKMAGNMRDRGLAFQAAEAATRDAESFIQGVAFISAFNGGNGLLGKNDAEPADYFAAAIWVQGSSRQYTGGKTDLKGVASQPHYIIKYLGDMNGSGSSGLYGSDDFGADTRNLFKITARGTGQSATSQVILQTYYARTGL